MATRSANGYTLGDSQEGPASCQIVTGASLGDANNQYAFVNNDLDRYLLGGGSTVNTAAPGYAEFTIDLNNNPNVPFEFTAGNIGPTSISLARVIYHEAIHSMGFSAANDQNGLYDFAVNGNNGPPTIWDTHLYDATTGQAFTADTQNQRMAVMASGTDQEGHGGQLFFNGVAADAANGGAFVQMYAPATFVPGSSDGSHLGPDNPALDLLQPFQQYGVALTPSPIDLAMLNNIGWKLSSPAAVPEASTTVSFGLLLALGLSGMVVAAKKKKTTSQTG